MTQKRAEHTIPHWIMNASCLLCFVLLGIVLLYPGSSLLERLRWLDSGICAQLPSHSFYPGGVRLPMCARNTGIYLGFVVTLIALSISGRGKAQHTPPRLLAAVLSIGIAALGVDGLNSLAFDLGLPHLYQPHNLLRLATGLLTGLALAVFILPMMNRWLWHTYIGQRSITSSSDLILLTAPLTLCLLATASQSLVVLYPIALLSTAGLLAAVTMMNIMIITLVSKKSESFVSYRQLLPIFCLACACAIGELAMLAQMRAFTTSLLGV